MNPIEVVKSLNRMTLALESILKKYQENSDPFKEFFCMQQKKKKNQISRKTYLEFFKV